MTFLSKVRIEDFPSPQRLSEIEGYAREDRREHQEKFKTFSKFQINSRKQIPIKYQNMKERNEPDDF